MASEYIRHFFFFLADFFFAPHLEAAAFFAISARCSGESIAKPLGTFAYPPLRPSETAAGSFAVIGRSIP